MEPIKVGIIGLGGIATRTHLPLWLKMKGGVRVVALCDVDTKKLEQASERFRVEKFYEDMYEMLEKEDIDLIDICTPPNTHKDLCLKALDAGINCMVEKPMTTTVDAADELIKAARDKKLNLFVIHNCSFVPVLRKAKDLVYSGEIGDILQVDVKFSSPFGGELPPSHWAHKLPGGIFGELAPHPCHILVEFLIGEIEEVKTQMAKKSRYSLLRGDELQVLASTENAIGSFSVSTSSPTRKMTIDLIGSKLWVFVDAESQVLVKYPPISDSGAVFQRGKRALSDIFQRFDCLAAVSLNVMAGRYKPLIEGHEYLFRQAIRALRGQGTYPVSLDKVKKEVEILEAAFSQVEERYESQLIRIS